jgi:hypothetical protein
VEQVPLFDLNDGQGKLCTAPDFARTRDVPVQTLYSAVQSSRILHTRVHGRLYLNLESAEKFMLTYRKYTTEEK